mmetsp:Transcript_29607/g.48850  ORF Transcript_29607/g.48850 Transcript_29607/m.48850 type:complete len:388 (+) Transcript_29607:98-1261(+)|eukprot:CAMPEP_0119013346 /NCGR_PEP_ID=MMETSP1176-20130426/8402_1 /TAXON_ID=265551 /ORGANISM="Synedropsis recta cf, Strain CCMP1620" /LENGTH=387 /DNA_ID=CAMNT_0006966433 /DNA_START=76 /DNA_END=1239 /DNA_ORIENTATION=+
MASSDTPSVVAVVEEEDPLEFEEWDGTSPFWSHCLAGSLAGVAEHVVVYPLDTVKTHIQCATCPANPAKSSVSAAAAAASRSLNKGATAANKSALKTAATAAAASSNSSKPAGLWTTMRHIVSQPNLTATAVAERQQPLGYARLWRGVQSVMVGCVPAHALYFSSYEFVKFQSQRPDGTLPYWGGLLAGATAVVGHDVIMSPLDTIKQRLQLGHYSGMKQAAAEMVKHEGAASLYRSFPVTLLTNIPYGSIMVSTNEVVKAYLTSAEQQQHVNYGQHGHHAPSPSIAVCLVSSSMGGLMASFLTTPLDRIKTVLQIQQLQPACERYGSCPKLSSERLEVRQAVKSILRQEGVAGLFKGSLPRMLSHTPAVAISWTTYETAKQWLAQL